MQVQTVTIAGEQRIRFSFRHPISIVIDLILARPASGARTGGTIEDTGHTIENLRHISSWHEDCLDCEWHQLAALARRSERPGEAGPSFSIFVEGKNGRTARVRPRKTADETLAALHETVVGMIGAEPSRVFGSHAQVKVMAVGLSAEGKSAPATAPKPQWQVNRLEVDAGIGRLGLL